METLTSPSPFRKLRALSGPDFLLLAESVVFLALARVALVCLPFRILAGWLGEVNRESPEGIPEAKEARARRIGWALPAAARRMPWNTLCLTQATAACWMLRLRHIPCTVYLGTGREGTSGERPLFHAWVRSGTCAVTGGKGRGFQILGRFTAGHGSST